MNHAVYFMSNKTTYTVFMRIEVNLGTSKTSKFASMQQGGLLL